MGKGYLTISAKTADESLPVSNAKVVISKNGTILHETYTDANGNTEKFLLDAPDVALSLDPSYMEPAYAVYEVDVEKEGFVAEHIHDVQVLDTQTSILPVAMLPLPKDTPKADEDIYIPPPAILQTVEKQSIGMPNEFNARQAVREVFIPDYITVHLGTPTNASARNVRVKFMDYIKNVTSSEIYSTWPENALIANIHAIVTFAINRVYTEWYPSRGFNFDITNSTAFDQAFVYGRNIYENISRIVDNYFNVYARRYGFRNPFFTQYCNGTTVTCNGLSQWGTVPLANQGLTPIQILHRFYPNDLELIRTNNIQSITSTYPGYALRNGSSGPHVERMQNYLNRIRINYPLIPQISSPDGVFGPQTEAAVRAFQRAFNMTADGVIGQGTWYKIIATYVGVIKLAELKSEGQRIGIGQTPPTSVLSVGSKGEDVNQLQFILNFIAPYYATIPPVIKDSSFGTTTKNAVVEFQKTFNLTPDGVVGPATWNKLYSVYRGVDEGSKVPPTDPPDVTNAPKFPGVPLRVGSSGQNVRIMQSYLNTIRAIYTSIPLLVVDGQFGPATRDAVIAFQREFVLTPDGIIGPITWNKIVEQFLLVSGQISVSTAFPGTNLTIGSRGQNVRLMQIFLNEIQTAYPNLPSIAVDGIFGPQTRAAVLAFQNQFNLSPTGIIGINTWNAIVQKRNELFG